MTLTIVLSAVLFTGSVMALNYIVNPLGKYESTVLPSLVWTGRSDKTELLQEFDKNPDVLILGSSRTMKLDPNYVEKETGLTAFNAGVNSARAEDYYVMLRYILDELHMKPRYIFLGIDIEAFHNKTAIDERLLFNGRLAKYLYREDQASFVEKLTSLLSFQETVNTVRSLYYFATEYPDPSTEYEDNGFLHYTKKEEAMKEGDFEPEIAEYIEKYRDRFKGFTHLSPDRKRYFNDFLARAEKNDIQVVSFITTLHDDIIADLKKTRNYDEVKQELTAFLDEKEGEYANFNYEDFDRVDKYNGSLTAFYDGAHIQEKNANLITAQLLKKVNVRQAAYQMPSLE